MSFLLHLNGLVVVIAGLAWIATLLGASPTWVTITAGFLLALAVVAAFTSARVQDRGA